MKEWNGLEALALIENIILENTAEKQVSDELAKKLADLIVTALETAK